jgi:hypothetical protein
MTPRCAPLSALANNPWQPKGRSLEELDVIFAIAHSKKENPVKTTRETPRLQGPELERELERYFDTDAVPA